MRAFTESPWVSRLLSRSVYRFACALALLTALGYAIVIRYLMSDNWDLRFSNVEYYLYPWAPLSIVAIVAVAAVFGRGHRRVAVGFAVLVVASPIAVIMNFFNSLSGPLSR
jgi:hypothetical protein